MIDAQWHGAQVRRVDQMHPGQLGVIHAAGAADAPGLLQQAVRGVPFKMRVVLGEGAREVARHVGSPRCVLAPPHDSERVRRQFEALKRVDGPALLVVFGECVAACTDILCEAYNHGRYNSGMTVLIAVIGDVCPLLPALCRIVDVFYVSQGRSEAFIGCVWRAYFSDEPLGFVRRRLAAAHPQRVTHDRCSGFRWYHLTGGAEGLYESSSPHAAGADGGCWLYLPALQKILLGVKPEALTAADGECPVCLEDSVPGQAVWRCCRCNHCVHAQCGKRWLAMKATCVLCRAPWSLAAMKNPV